MQITDKDTAVSPPSDLKDQSSLPDLKDQSSCADLSYVIDALRLRVLSVENASKTLRTVILGVNEPSK
jgi:hypothetical protein